MTTRQAADRIGVSVRHVQRRGPTALLTELAGGRRRALAALDLAGSTDAREPSAGRRLLEGALERLRG